VVLKSKGRRLSSRSKAAAYSAKEVLVQLLVYELMAQKIEKVQSRLHFSPKPVIAVENIFDLYPSAEGYRFARSDPEQDLCQPRQCRAWHLNLYFAKRLALRSGSLRRLARISMLGGGGVLGLMLQRSKYKVPAISSRQIRTC
jgi:hypothetical protein